MDSAIPAGYSSLVRCLSKSSPGKRDIPFWRQTGFDVRASRGKGHGIPEFVAVGEESKNLGASCAESAMTGDVFRERRRRKRAHLIRNPPRTIKSLCPMERTPSRDLLTMKQI